MNKQTAKEGILKKHIGTEYLRDTLGGEFIDKIKKAMEEYAKTKERVLPTSKESDIESERLVSLFSNEKASKKRNFILGWRESAGFHRTFKTKTIKN